MQINLEKNKATKTGYFLKFIDEPLNIVVAVDEVDLEKICNVIQTIKGKNEFGLTGAIWPATKISP